MRLREFGLNRVSFIDYKNLVVKDNILSIELVGSSGSVDYFIVYT